MKRFIKDIFIIALLFFMMAGCIFIGIVSFPPKVFNSSYQSVIQAKYNNLLTMDSPRLIIVGGSSAGFGIDEDLLKEKTGYNVVNLGLHASFGGLFNTELIRGNLKKGDIVLLGYEYNWVTSGYFDQLGIDLVMSGIDDNLLMYKQLPLNKIPEVMGYLFTFANKKRTFPGTDEGIYSSSSFDAVGKMTLKRPQYVIEDSADNKSIYNSINLYEFKLEKDTILYLKRLKKYIEKNDAKAYFIAPPLLDVANGSKPQDFIKLKEMEEKEIGIKYISNPLEYIFPSAFMFDTIYHCNERGEKYRTQLLIDDLRREKIIISEVETN